LLVRYPPLEPVLDEPELDVEPELEVEPLDELELDVLPPPVEDDELLVEPPVH
jgi:hypothetical protein